MYVLIKRWGETLIMMLHLITKVEAYTFFSLMQKKYLILSIHSSSVHFLFMFHKRPLLKPFCCMPCDWRISSQFKFKGFSYLPSLYLPHYNFINLFLGGGNILLSILSMSPTSSDAIGSPGQNSHSASFWVEAGGEMMLSLHISKPF